MNRLFPLRRAWLAASAALAMLAITGCATVDAVDKKYARTEDLAVAERQVRSHESDFASTMAERDFAGFQSFLSEEAVFFSGPPGAEALRGRAAVAAHWQRWFEGPKAPFSWSPEKVEVLESGTLAISTGPVYDPNGRQIATFTSIWRKEGAAKWRVVFDKGCNCGDRR
ncbi:YybH family protein [Rivibacter subsaxonicus]|uniref:Ketosteroid isomerase-like protein n=1 Tax=Rivibacter subsaxonicus TaxID=457575 RepID=A0A4Q7W1W6_9BURK|nr:nuclear transport factor 2 family protein [Rivibacter subsaxonicus]RZU02938.1 ketosteroid isomerase-like protein [Rivibacter subsaxonicus]